MLRVAAATGGATAIAANSLDLASFTSNVVLALGLPIIGSVSVVDFALPFLGGEHFRDLNCFVFLQ